RAADPSQPESPAKTHSVSTIKTSPVEKAPEKTKNTKGNVAETSPFTASPESQPKDDQLALNTKKSFNEDDNKNANNDPGNNEEPTEMEKSPVPPAPLVKPTETAVTAETNEQLAQTTDTEKKDEAEKA